VKAAIAKPPAAAMTSRYWQLPQNWRELLAEVKWATGNGLTMEVKAPLTVTAALTEQKHPERWFVHLLNYDGEHAPTVSDIEVGLHAPPGREIARVTIVSPDGGGPVVVPVLVLLQPWPVVVVSQLFQEPGQAGLESLKFLVVASTCRR
jgi:hypothetical protein